MVGKHAPEHLVKVWLCIYVDMTAPFRLRLDYWVNHIRSLDPGSTDRDDAKEEAEKMAQLQLDPPA